MLEEPDDNVCIGEGFVIRNLNNVCVNLNVVMNPLCKTRSCESECHFEKTDLMAPMTVVCHSCDVGW